MSEEVVSKLLPIAGPLLGVLVGSPISWFTAQSLEHPRWRCDRQEKPAALRRDVLATAPEWIEPIRNV